VLLCTVLNYCLFLVANLELDEEAGSDDLVGHNSSSGAMEKSMGLSRWSRADGEREALLRRSVLLAPTAHT